MYPKIMETKLYSTPDQIRLVNKLRPDVLIVTSKVLIQNFVNLLQAHQHLKNY